MLLVFVGKQHVDKRGYNNKVIGKLASGSLQCIFVDTNRAWNRMMGKECFARLQAL